MLLILATPQAQSTRQYALASQTTMETAQRALLASNAASMRHYLRHAQRAV